MAAELMVQTPRRAMAAEYEVRPVGATRWINRYGRFAGRLGRTAGGRGNRYLRAAGPRPGSGSGVRFGSGRRRDSRSRRATAARGRGWLRGAGREGTAGRRGMR